MAKPTKLPEWATNGTTIFDPFSGQGNVVEPPTSKKIRGWDYREKAPRNWLNWWMNLVYVWLLWLSDLITSDNGSTVVWNGNRTHAIKVIVLHDDRVLSLNAASANATNGSFSRTATTGAINSTGATDIIVDIPLHQGDRIKSVTFARLGDGAVDATDIDVNTVNAGGVATTIGTATITNVGAAWADTTIDVSDTTLAAGDSVMLKITVNGTGFSVNNIRVTYDHPA